MRTSCNVEFGRIKICKTIFIYGVEIKIKDFECKLIDNIYDIHLKSYRCRELKPFPKLEYISLGLCELDIRDLTDDNNLELEYNPKEYIYFIGGSIDKMRDDQTFGDFKKEVKEKLLNIGIEKEPELLLESFVYV